MSIRDVLRFYDSYTNVRRIMLYSARIVRIWLDSVTIYKMYWEMLHESVKTVHRKHLRIIYESCTNKGTFVAVLDSS